MKGAWLIALLLGLLSTPIPMLYAAPSDNTWDPFADNTIAVDYHPPLLSIEAKDAPLPAIFARIAAVSKQNIVCQVANPPRVTISLKDLPVQQVFDTLVNLYGLAASKQPHLWIVQSPENGAKPTSIMTQVFPLRYAKAAALKKVLQDIQAVHPEYGHVTSDTRLNALVVQDEIQHLQTLRRLIEDLDQPAQQLFIEARILNAAQGFSKALGLSFTNQAQGTFGEFAFTLSKLPKGIDLNVHLTAVEKHYHTEVIAAPTLLTSNQQKAVIKQGKELAFEETSSSGATSVRFKEAVLLLSVLPQITPQGEIVLELDVKHDVVGALDQNGQPTIDTQSVQTQARLRDGETVVLGGIYTTLAARHQQLLPFLGKIPLLGGLFKDKFRQRDKSELLIFVTPHILNN